MVGCCEVKTKQLKKGCDQPFRSGVAPGGKTARSVSAVVIANAE